MVHELPSLLRLEPLEHRKVDDPQELVAVGIEQVFAFGDVQPQLAEDLGCRLAAACRHQEQIGRTGT